jgi:hypothetical protein
MKYLGQGSRFRGVFPKPASPEPKFEFRSLSQPARCTFFVFLWEVLFSFPVFNSVHLSHVTCFYSFLSTVPSNLKASGSKRTETPALGPSSHLDHIRFAAADETFLTYNDSVLCCLKVSHWMVREAGPDGFHFVTWGAMWLDLNSRCGYISYYSDVRGGGAASDKTIFSHQLYCEFHSVGTRMILRVTYNHAMK